MKIIGIGEVVWDCFPEGKRLGGAPINFCFFAKELGAESYPVTAIGDDELGDETFTVLKETGLDLGYISRNILPTGKVLVSLNDSAPNSFAKKQKLIGAPPSLLPSGKQSQTTSPIPIIFRSSSMTRHINL